MEAFASYGYAIASLAIYSVLVLLMSPITSLKKSAQGLPAGGTPDNDYDNSAYRWNRAYLNSTETAGVFAACVLAAVLAGVSPFWVNLLAWIFLAARVLHTVVHIAGIKPMNQGPRTIAYVIGWACCLVMAIMAVVAVL